MLNNKQGTIQALNKAASPTLILENPEPRVMVIDTLGNREKVVSALRLRI